MNEHNIPPEIPPIQGGQASETPLAKSAADEEEMDITEVQDMNFIKNPEVGEQITFISNGRIIKRRGREAYDKKANRKFNTSLSGVDFQYIIKTIDGKEYAPSTWEVFHKIKNMFVEKGSPLKITVKHLIDGRTDAKAQNERRCYEVMATKPTEQELHMEGSQ